MALSPLAQDTFNFPSGQFRGAASYGYKNVEMLYNLEPRNKEREIPFSEAVNAGKDSGMTQTGRRKTSRLKNLRYRFGENSLALFRSTTSKVRIAMTIANFRR